MDQDLGMNHSWDPIFSTATELPNMEENISMNSNTDNSSGEHSSPPQDQDSTEEQRTTTGRKKNYQRYPKPPYSYLAMIALVIQASPEKKLKLFQILQEISNLFPFFQGAYKGWKDSVRHNLSSNDCFQKVLKDSTNSKAKGNYWKVDLSKIPPEAMKIQNTGVIGQNTYQPDLSEFIFQGRYPHPPRHRDTHRPKPEAAAQASTSAPDPASTFPAILLNLPTSYSRLVPPNVVAPPSPHPLTLYPQLTQTTPYHYSSPRYQSNPYQDRRELYSSSLQPQIPQVHQIPQVPQISQIPLSQRPIGIRSPTPVYPPNRTVYEVPIPPAPPGYVPNQGVYVDPLVPNAGLLGYRHPGIYG